MKFLESLKQLNIKILYSLLAATGLLITSFLIFSPYIPYSINFNVGDIAPTTIESPRYLEFESKSDLEKTIKLRQERAQLAEKIYSIDEETTKITQAKVISSFTKLKELRTQNQPIKNNPSFADITYVNTKELQAIKKLDNIAFSSIEYLTIKNTEQLLKTGINKINTANIKQTIYSNLEILDLDEIYKNFIFKIIINSLKPNLYYDEAKTLAAVEKEKESVSPFKTILKNKQQIILKNDIVTPEHIEILKALNIYGSRANIYQFISILILNFFLFLLLERFIYFFHYNPYYKSKKYFILIYIVSLIVLGFAKSIQEISILPNIFNFNFLIPIPLAAMLITLLIGPNISFISGILLSILITILNKSDFQLFIYLFLANSATLFTIYKKYTRTSLIASGYIVGILNVILVVTFGLFNEMQGFLWFAANITLAFVNGVVSSMLALAILPYFEGLFKITTKQQLLELSNLNHPLLKKLMLTAPGTYQHSLMVANFAETAAENIDANPLLARIGAYFHDVGKIKRPIFFSENQFSNENPHKTLSPRMSKIIIASHPKDGVEIAKKYKLPQVVKDIISEHHGTSLVSFFYSQVMKTEKTNTDKSIEKDFRYPGPKPSSKESGIIMLADSVEAAVRALEKPTPTKIENLINKIFKDKIDTGQLDQSPLSLQEINKIKESFLIVIKGISHNRLDYEEEIKNIISQNNKTNPSEK
jgi:cyclic-di-AMP phosphodiesterase PgpH